MPDPRDTMPDDVRRIYDREVADAVHSSGYAKYRMTSYSPHLDSGKDDGYWAGHHANIALALRSQEDRIQALREAVVTAKLHWSTVKELASELADALREDEEAAQ